MIVLHNAACSASTAGDQRDGGRYVPLIAREAASGKVVHDSTEFRSDAISAQTPES